MPPIEEFTLMMQETSKYWRLVRIDAAEVGRGYKIQPLPLAQQFFAALFPEAQTEQVNAADIFQNQLFQILRSNDEHQDCNHAELCLRCYISHPILQSCLKRARLFGPGNGFTYRDLLPFVLNDDGKPTRGSFVPFAIEILHSYSPSHQCSLTGWVDLRVRRNPELNQFLVDCGLRFTSDWALLNQANLKHLSGLDQTLVKVFHCVYRRDRPHQHQQGIRSRCPDPSDDQLQEMMQLLRKQSISIYSTQSLMSHLKRIAQCLRQEDIWGRRGFPIAEPLETTDPETGETSIKEIPDFTSIDNNEVDEQSELQQFCCEQLLTCLNQGIRQAIDNHVRHLEQRPRYAGFAHKVRPALNLLYFEGKTQSQIAALLGMTSQCQVSRVLNPKELVMSIRQRTLEALLHQILEKAQQMKIVEIPVSPEYFTNLMQQLEAFIDDQIFYTAIAEISASRDRSMNSLFARHLREILNEQLQASTACHL